MRCAADWRFGTTPPTSKAPDRPDFIADSILLAVSREKDGRLRLVYAGWGDAKAVQPSRYGQARSGWRGGCYPLQEKR
jgi:hypothetical protein